MKAQFTLAAVAALLAGVIVATAAFTVPPSMADAGPTAPSGPAADVVVFVLDDEGDPLDQPVDVVAFATNNGAERVVDQKKTDAEGRVQLRLPRDGTYGVWVPRPPPSSNYLPGTDTDDGFIGECGGNKDTSRCLTVHAASGVTYLGTAVSTGNSGTHGPDGKPIFGITFIDRTPEPRIVALMLDNTDAVVPGGMIVVTYQEKGVTKVFARSNNPLGRTVFRDVKLGVEYTVTFTAPKGWRIEHADATGTRSLTVRGGAVSNQVWVDLLRVPQDSASDIDLGGSAPQFTLGQGFELVPVEPATETGLDGDQHEDSKADESGVSGADETPQSTDPATDPRDGTEPTGDRPPLDAAPAPSHPIETDPVVEQPVVADTPPVQQVPPAVEQPTVAAPIVVVPVEPAPEPVPVEPVPTPTADEPVIAAPIVVVPVEPAPEPVPVEPVPTPTADEPVIAAPVQVLPAGVVEAPSVFEDPSSLGVPNGSAPPNLGFALDQSPELIAECLSVLELTPELVMALPELVERCEIDPLGTLELIAELG